MSRIIKLNEPPKRLPRNSTCNKAFHEVPDLVICHRSLYNIIIMFNASPAINHKIKPLIKSSKYFYYNTFSSFM